jgi:predicted ArsR family transcriptional regulator
MHTLQQQARALGDPSRHAIFRYVVEAGAPVGVAELTEHLGLHHNAVRQHLSKLVDAGLLVPGTMPPTGRGRPRLCYHPAPSVDSRWGVQGPYERLSLLLSEMVRSGESAVVVGHRAGATAHVAAGTAAADPVEALRAEMDRQGFAPRVSEHDGVVELTLDNCPFATTAAADPGTVCNLHLGIARGVADATGGLVVDELEPHDPHQAGCRLRCRRTPTVS